MFTLNEITRAFTGKNLFESDQLFTEAVVDSRLSAAGTLFIAIPGENTDGHKFVSSAFANGARAALIQEEIEGDYIFVDLREGTAADTIKSGTTNVEKPVCIRVENTIAALQKIAAFHRTQLPKMEVTGITGSVGKTTTKELMYDVISDHYRTLKTLGNKNNEIGLPMTLLRADENTEQAILEMGFYVPGEIDQLCQIAKPSVGIITNVGMVHASRAGSMEVIAQGKSELIRALPDDGTAILNYDDPYVRPMADLTKANIFYYGTDPAADLYAIDINSKGLEGIDFTLIHKGQKHPIHLPWIGRQSVMTALRGTAFGLVKGLSWDEITERLRGSHNQLRLRLTRTFSGSMLIDDSYNASPESTAAALSLLSEVNGRKTAVLGDMKELGQYEQKGHRMIGEKVAQICDKLIAVGPAMKITVDTAIEKGMNPESIQWFATSAEAADYLINHPSSKDEVLLVKGSLSMNMAHVVSKLEEKK